MPYVNDFFCHVFFYAKHIATAHTENGSFHVHFEAAKNASEENNKEGNMPSSSKEDNSITEYCLFSNNDEPFFGDYTHRCYMPVTNDAAVPGNTGKHYPPPRC